MSKRRLQYDIHCYSSHKPNTAVPQVWYNAQQGVKNVVTETGVGQWGSSLAFACSLFGVNCEVSIGMAN